MIDNFGLYFITDSKLSKKGNLSDVSAAIHGGARIIQYRDKEKSDEDFTAEALQIKKICNEDDILFIINDRAHIARNINSDGLHIGMEDISLQEARKMLPNKIIGVTVHSIDEAVAAEKQGADYLGVSPIFDTNTKPDAGKAAGAELIKEVKKKVTIPIVAIGGINENNLREVLDAGCYNIAMISAIVTKENIEEEVRKINGMIYDSIGKGKDE